MHPKLYETPLCSLYEEIICYATRHRGNCRQIPRKKIITGKLLIANISNQLNSYTGQNIQVDLLILEIPVSK